jgi:hypothetical protein
MLGWGARPQAATLLHLCALGRRSAPYAAWLQSRRSAVHPLPSFTWVLEFSRSPIPLAMCPLWSVDGSKPLKTFRLGVLICTACRQRRV